MDSFLFVDEPGVDRIGQQKRVFREPILGMPLKPRSMNALAGSRQLVVFLVGVNNHKMNCQSNQRWSLDLMFKTGGHHMRAAWYERQRFGSRGTHGW